MGEYPAVFAAGKFVLKAACAEGNNMEEKIFKTYDEQIALLGSRGIVFTDAGKKSNAKKILQREGYYNLINGYSQLFRLNGETYKPGTTVQEIYELYRFDKALRNIFLQSILKMETNIKSLLSYVFSEAYGHKNFLIYRNFNTQVKDAQQKITSLISEIQLATAKRASDPSISHYLNEHGYIPLWVLNTILSLGTVSKFYSLLKIPERQAISKTFKISDGLLENILLYLTPVRNFCAHENRLYCYRTKKPLHDMPHHEALSLPKKQGEYVNGKRDLFAALIALKPLLSKRDFRTMLQEIHLEIGKMRKKLRVLQMHEIYGSMGFPENWMQLGKL